MIRDIEKLIIRMREATSQKVANTAMISETDLSAAADALESLEADRDSWERQAGDRLDDVLRVVAERDAIAAELKALWGQEPVVIYGGRRLTPENTKEMWGYLVSEYEPWDRSSLYAHPVPARELTDADIALCIASADKSFAQERISGKPVLGVWSKHLARAIERYLKGESE